MKTKIEDRSDVERMVNSFYDRLKKDPLLSPLFIHVSWDRHLPVMYDFWENALFYTGGYDGNPLLKHQLFHKKHPLTRKHFIKWVSLFVSTVDENFEGEKAELAKQRANSIATVMMIKIAQAPK